MPLAFNTLVLNSRNDSSFFYFENIHFYIRLYTFSLLLLYSRRQQRKGSIYHLGTSVKPLKPIFWTKSKNKWMFRLDDLFLIAIYIFTFSSTTYNSRKIYLSFVLSSKGATIFPLFREPSWRLNRIHICKSLVEFHATRKQDYNIMVRSRCTKTVCLRCATWNHRDTIAQLLFTALSSGKSFWKILRFVSAYPARAILFQKFLQRSYFDRSFETISNEYYRRYPPLLPYIHIISYSC